MIDDRPGQERKPVKDADNMFPKSEPKLPTGNQPKSQKPGGKTPPCEHY